MSDWQPPDPPKEVLDLCVPGGVETLNESYLDYVHGWLLANGGVELAVAQKTTKHGDEGDKR